MFDNSSNKLIKHSVAKFFLTFYCSKGQLISKAIYGLLTSLKKQMNKLVLFAFLLFTANKSISSIHFLGESMARQSLFWF